MIKTYMMLTKPGIIMGNLITTASGFALASRGNFNFLLFLTTLVGIGFVIASSCIFNNYIDRIADEKMSRTKNRGFAKKTASIPLGISLAIILILAGAAILAFFTNLLAMTLALFGFAVYVVIYSFLKYHSTLGTVIGSTAGALPPVVGYCAVTASFDAGALLLFLILVLWQMPHFYAIALYRFADYKAASIPVLPIKKGIITTKIYMMLYILGFIIAELLLVILGYTGIVSLVIATTMSIIWLVLSLRGFKAANDVRWARQMFQWSLVVIITLSLMISFDTI